MLSVGCSLLLLATAAAAPPSVTLTVSPTEPDAAGPLVYARIGAVSGNHTTSGRLWFTVRVMNNSALIDYKITRVQATLLTGQLATVHPFDRDIDLPRSGVVEIGLTAAEVIYLPAPAPDTVVISVFSQGNPEPKTWSRPLAAYVAPVPGGQYIFPADEGDLGPEQYFSGGTHEPPHNQGWGTDWRVYRIDSTDTHLDYRLGGSNSVNADALGWGIPIRAIATGTVLRTVTGIVNNPSPGVRAFQKMGEVDGEQISDVKVTRLSSTRAASLQRLPAGGVQLSVWEMADVGRQITRLGSSPIQPGELVTHAALDALTDERVVGILRLTSGTERLVVWTIADGGATVTRVHGDGAAVEEVAIAKMSASRFATAVRAAGGGMRVTVWSDEGNFPQPLASDSAGDATSLCITGLSETRAVTSLRTVAGTLKVIVWDFVSQGGNQVQRTGERTLGAITRVAASVATKTGWLRNRWVTASRTNPGGVIQLHRWDASDNGPINNPELVTTTNVAISDTALALAPGRGKDGADNVTSVSVLAGGTFKINGWGDPDAAEPATYEYSAQNTAGLVDRVSLDETDETDYFVGARTTGGELKIMTWHWAGGSGNCVYVLHGNCRVLYAHFQEGSVKTNVLYPGATVSAGQILGRMGNSGSSGDVHTHIHADRLDPMPPTVQEVIDLETAGTIGTLVVGPRPLPFHQARTMRIDWIVRGGETANAFATMSGHGTYAPDLGIRPRLNTRYVVHGLANVAPNGFKDMLPNLNGGPWRTVGDALGGSPSGTRLYLRGGSYQENVLFTTPMTIRRYDYYDADGPVVIQR